MKRIISIILSVVIILSMSISVFADFSQITEIPLATTSADVLSKLGIMVGTEKGMELERNVTRAEAVVLLMRMHPAVTGAYGLPRPVFSDMDGHWAYKEVTYANKIGLVDGVGEGLFEPDRNVSGKEFAKMTLSMLGYTDITIENAYDKAVEVESLLNNFSKKVVYENSILTRSDVARICRSALLAKTSENIMLKTKLCQVGKFKEEDFRVLGSASPLHLSFADRLNEKMPDDKNYMFSPLSIKRALAMAANGAEGETQKEILDAIGVNDLPLHNNAVKKLLATYSQSELLNLSVANSIWLNSDQTEQRFSKDYEKKIADIFDATSDIVDNGNATKEINGWVNEKTNGKIPTIITEDNKDFWAMLVNAVYFKGRWQDEFSKSATKEDVFTDKNGKENKIDFMNKTSWMQFANENDVIIVELPYLTREDKVSEEGEYLGTNKLEDIDISMYLMMADKEFNPERVLQQAQMERGYIRLSVPKFNVEYGAEISEILKSLGIKKAFEKDAEFELMFDKDNMWIDSAIHKTYIKVDEAGTEAAAVTAIGMQGTSLPPEPTVIKYNKPFTFVIKDNINGEILFMGEYAFAE